MSERTRVLDRRVRRCWDICVSLVESLIHNVKHKINDCLEYLREMQEIEIQLQQYCGVQPHNITTLCTCDIDLWLQRWKIARGRDPEYYTCLLGILGKACHKIQVAKRIKMIRALHLIYEYKGLKPPGPVVDADPSQLQALHEEHLQDELNLLEQHLCQIRAKHWLLAHKLRSKVV